MNPTYREKQRRRAAVQAHIQAHGYTCPGWGVPAHPSMQLEACHVVPRYSGGEQGPLKVMCHACNNRQRHSPHPGARR